MKKILACAICLFSIAATHTAFAANPTGYLGGPITLGTGAVNTDNPPLVVQLSSNVQMNYAGTATTGLYYTIAAFHTKGNRTYTSTSNDAKIYYYDGTNQGYFTLPTTSASTTPPTGWLPL
jgi:hypothetical protein